MTGGVGGGYGQALGAFLLRARAAVYEGRMGLTGEGGGLPLSLLCSLPSLPPATTADTTAATADVRGAGAGVGVGAGADVCAVSAAPSAVSPRPSRLWVCQASTSSIVVAWSVDGAPAAAAGAGAIIVDASDAGAVATGGSASAAAAAGVGGDAASGVAASAGAAGDVSGDVSEERTSAVDGDAAGGTEGEATALSPPSLPSPAHPQVLPPAPSPAASPSPSAASSPSSPTAPSSPSTPTLALTLSPLHTGAEPVVVLVGPRGQHRFEGLGGDAAFRVALSVLVPSVLPAFASGAGIGVGSAAGGVVGSDFGGLGLGLVGVGVDGAVEGESSSTTAQASSSSAPAPAVAVAPAEALPPTIAPAALAYTPAIAIAPVPVLLQALVACTSAPHSFAFSPASLAPPLLLLGPRTIRNTVSLVYNI